MGYQVDLDQLQGVITELQAFGRTLEAKLVELDGASDDLHVTWQGEAAAAHTQAHAQLMLGAREVRQGLAAMREAATRAHTNYTNAADANVRTWQQLR